MKRLGDRPVAARTRRAYVSMEAMAQGDEEVAALEAFIAKHLKGAITPDEARARGARLSTAL